MFRRCKAGGLSACPAWQGRSNKARSKAVRPQTGPKDTQQGWPGSASARTVQDRRRPTGRSRRKTGTCFCTRGPVCLKDWEQTIKRSLEVRQPFYPQSIAQEVLVGEKEYSL